MATAAIKNHLIPKALRSDEQDNHQDRRAQDAVEHEKQFLVHWEDERRQLEPEEITEQSDWKILGHSSNYLRPDDFRLIKTLGTGSESHPPEAKLTVLTSGLQAHSLEYGSPK